MAKAKTFNLASLDTIAACNKPFELEVQNVNGEPTGFFLSLLGKDSDTYRSRIRALADESLRQQATGKKPVAETVSSLEAKNLDALVAATVGWRVGDSATVQLGDEHLEFNPGNVRKVYERLLPVREQALEAINTLENFMPA